MNITYCKTTGKQHTLEYPDDTSIGVHRRGVQITIPLGKDGFEILSMPNKTSIVLNSDEQIDLLIERLSSLKKLKVMYNKPVEEVAL